MITLYTGAPRSGKSYRVVYTLLRESVQGKYYILHDIDDLKHDSFINPKWIRRIHDFLAENNVNMDTFLSVDYLKGLTESIQATYGRNLLIVIDEAYKFFKKSTEAKLELLAYHGHLGMDIWLIAQGKHLIHKDYHPLVGEIIHAKKGRVINFFLYSHSDGKVNFESSRLPKRKEIFAAYKSFNVAETKKRASLMLPLMIGGVLCMIIWFALWARNPFGKEKGASEAIASSETKASKESGKTPEKENKDKLTRKEAKSDSEETVSQYSFAALLGKKILLQRVEGGELVPLGRVLPGARFVDTMSGGVIVLHDGKYVGIHRQGIRLADNNNSQQAVEFEEAKKED